MFTRSRLLLLLICVGSVVFAQTTTTPVTVGSGVSTVLQTRFQIAFFRGGFSAPLRMFIHLEPLA